MTQADVSGSDTNMVSLWNNRDTPERNVPLIRLDNDADLRVWNASIHDSTTFNMLCCGAATEKVTHVGYL